MIYIQDHHKSQKNNIIKILLPTFHPIMQQSNPCTDVKYVDARNWYDFSQQILCLIATIMLLIHVMKHYYNLRRQKEAHQQSEKQKSIRRKMSVNMIQIIYLGFLALTTIFDCVLWVLYNKQDSRIYIKQHRIDNLYKLTEVFYINWLNTLNLTVGFLYWKATRAYYVLSKIDVPVLFRRWMKKVFFLTFCFNASAIIVAFLFLIIFQYNTKQSFDSRIFTLSSTIISIIFCIGARTLYRYYILTKLNLSPAAIKKQNILSILLLFSSILRIILYTLDISGLDNWVVKIRNQQMDQNGYCKDQWIYYSLVMLGINVGVNLLPAAIYGHLFVSEVDTSMKRSRQLLRDDTQYQ